MPPSEVIHGYQLDQVLGKGAMGVVYRARQVALDRPVALKIISPELNKHPQWRDLFRREALLAARLEHPNVVPIYDAGEADGMPYLAMRLIDGQPLVRSIALAQLTPKTMLRILDGIASALDAAHEIGLVHGDVKPSNILVAEPDSHPYLLDFGIARAAATPAGAFMGTLAYVSPEQIRGESLSPAADIYALTAVLHECLTGDVAFPRLHEAAVLHAHLAEEPPGVGDHDAVHRALDPIVRRGMAKHPEHRFATASQLVNHARAALATVDSEMLDSAIAYERPRGAPERRDPTTIVEPL
jgi:serine/threonine protein kinase